MTDTTRKYLGTALFALLILWGGYTTLVYYGVPVHNSALLTQDMNAGITPENCETGAQWCYLQRGMQALLPVIFYTLQRSAPFLGFTIISALLYGVFVFRKTSKYGKGTIVFRWSPWKIVGLGVAAVWLLTTTLSMGSAEGRAVRMYVEPTKDAYPTVSEQALGTLQQEFRSLQSKGCLIPTDQQFQTGAKIYNFSGFCVQGAFFTRIVPQILFIAVLILEMLVLGRGLLLLMRLRSDNDFTEMLFSLGLGACALIAILWSVAVAGVYTPTAGWAIALGIPLAGYSQTIYWTRKFLFTQWEDERPWYDVRLLLAWLLIGYIALNFLEVVRPFPIGWDDLGSYLNRPRLLVSYGSFIPTMSPFDWSYITSLGFLLFGYNSAFGSTSAMMVNWMAGLFAVLGVYGLAKTFLGNRDGTLSALLYYTLPLVGHFSFADMKIDNAVFFFGTLATLAVFSALFHHGHENMTDRKKQALFLMGGVFLGFAFATKSTAIMVIFPLMAVTLGILFSWEAFLGASFLGLAVFSKQRVLSIVEIAERVTGTAAGRSADTVFLFICLALGLGLIAFAVVKNRTFMTHKATLCASLILGMIIGIFPWMLHNNLSHGNLIPRLELSAKNTFSPGISATMLPAEIAVDSNSPLCRPSGAKEELDRYWGYGKGWSHYLTLPWRTVMNINSAGYYVTTIPALLLFPLLLLLPFFWSERGRWARYMWASTLFILFEWMFLANGIPWYGIGVFLGLTIMLELLTKEAPSRGVRRTAYVLIALSLVTAYGHRMWQFEDQRNIFEYSMGKISAESLREITIPYYDDIAEDATQRHTQIADRPYLYRIGTFIAYFVPKNLEVIGITDHQLDVFNCLYQERDPALTTKRLKALGFNSIVFDTNTATIEQDEAGSLHQKVNAFVEYVNNPAAGLQVIISDANAGIGYILIP